MFVLVPVPKPNHIVWEEKTKRRVEVKQTTQIKQKKKKKKDNFFQMFQKFLIIDKFIMYAFLLVIYLAVLTLE